MIYFPRYCCNWIYLSSVPCRLGLTFFHWWKK